MSLQYHVKLAPGDVAPYVLLPGDPGRVAVVASQWDEAREVASNREYVTYTGTYRGVPISCTSTGIGCPSTAIAMEELARVGATTFVRIGTCGTFQDRVRNGDMAVFDSAARYDGTSKLYAPIGFPAVADHEVVEAAIQAGRELGYPFHVGTTRSSDAFYALHGRPGSSFKGYWQSSWREHFEDLRRLNVVAAEMEASVIFVLARLWGLRAGGIAVVVDNVLKVSGPSGESIRRTSSRTGGTRSSTSRAWARRSCGSSPSAMRPVGRPRDAPVPRETRRGRRRAVRPAPRGPRTRPGDRLVLGRNARGRAQPRVRDVHRDLPRRADQLHLHRDRDAVHGDRARGLARVGATTFLRVGTCGGVQERMKVGDLGIFDAAVRSDGASSLYAPIEFPAAADHDVVMAAVAAAETIGVPFHIGTTLSTDLFYTPQEGVAFGGYQQSWARETFEDARRQNVLAVEMESSVLMVLTRIWGLRGGAISVVVDDVFASTNEAGEFDAEATFDVGASNIERLARVGSETIRILAERDAARPG